MAEEALVDVNRPFYEVVQAVVRELNEDHRLGPFYFSALIRFSERPADEWTLLLGSDALGKEPAGGLTKAASLLGERLPAHLARRITKLGVVKRSDPFYRTMSSSFGLPPFGLLILHQCVVDGLEIEQAAIFVSTRSNGTASTRRARA